MPRAYLSIKMSSVLLSLSHRYTGAMKDEICRVRKKKKEERNKANTGDTKKRRAAYAIINAAAAVSCES